MSDRLSIRCRLLILTIVMSLPGVVALGQKPGRPSPPPDRGDFQGPRGPGRDFGPGGDAGRGPGGPERGPGGPGGRRPGFGDPISILNTRFVSSKTVKDAPFSAVSETEFIQTLGDGSKIVKRNTGRIYRDAQGRVRREQQLNNIGPFVANNSTAEAPTMVFINDPVGGVSYQLDKDSREARKMQSRRGPPPAGDRPEMRASGDQKVESLGKQTIEGIEAEGTRTTITIPVGQIGNDRPIDIVSEQWYSPALQEVVLSKHRDPRFGEQTYRLTKIERAEPAASLFQPPSDYNVTEDGPPGGKGFRGPGKHRDDD